MWSSAQILGLAPDHFTAKAGRSLAAPQKWTSLGRAGHLFWGEIPLVNKPSQRIRIDLDGPVLNCSCGGRKRPCRHALGLALLAIHQPEAFPDQDPPDWVQTWQPRGRERRPVDDRSLTREETRRLQLLRAGMAELALWLRDLVDDGLATLPQRPKGSWERAANRLIDAQAGQVAVDVRQLASLVDSGRDWPERFLRQAGRLYLLTQAFQQYESLDPAAQGDLRAAAGWLPRRFGPPEGELLADTWQIVGQQTEQVGRQYQYRTWLWGKKSGRPALLARATYDRQGGSPLYTTGDGFTGEIHFAPAALPLLAEPDVLAAAAAGTEPAAGHATIMAAAAAYAAGLEQNPWLRHFPMLLAAVSVERLQGSWRIVDAKRQTLPLPDSHPHLYHLLALTGGEALPLFGEWNGQVFDPLSIYFEGGWLDLRALGGSH